MAVLNQVKVDPNAFVSANGKGGDSDTSALIEALKNLKVGDEMIAIETATPTEARGYGRRLNKALEELKLSEDQVQISKFDSKVASKLHAEGKPIMRYIRRVK
jgi:hypothetical protein